MEMSALFQEVGVSVITAIVLLLINHLREPSEPRYRHSVCSVLSYTEEESTTCTPGNSSSSPGLKKDQQNSNH